MVSTLAYCVTLPKNTELPSTLRVLLCVLLFSALLSVSFKSSSELRGNLDLSVAGKLFVSETSETIFSFKALYIFNY